MCPHAFQKKHVVHYKSFLDPTPTTPFEWAEICATDKKQVRKEHALCGVLLQDSKHMCPIYEKFVFFVYWVRRAVRDKKLKWF